MTLECTTCCSARFEGSSCMRPLALALAGESGGFAGAALQLLKEAAFSEPSPSYLEPFCDCLAALGTKLGVWGYEVDLYSLVLEVQKLQFF